ncbi:MAG: sulfatase-like hydrolase/transferase [Planctomycetota bacterium]
MPKRPNLLVIMTDHQRGDSVGMVQSGIEVCPNINRLAAEGASFSRAYNTCPLCVPARTALATGRYPTANGVVYNDWNGATARDHVTIHQMLAEAGYEMAHVGVHHIRVRPDLLDRIDWSVCLHPGDHAEYLKSAGVDESGPVDPAFKVTITETCAGKLEQRRYSSVHTAPCPGAVEHFKDWWFCDRAVQFLRRPHDRPFALFLYLWAPHPPLRVPEPYFSMFDPDRLELPANVGVPAEGEPPAWRAGAAARIAEGVRADHWPRVWAAHLGLVKLADDGIGRVLGVLEDVGEADETLVMFSSDHGDHLGQHGMYQKMEMYEQAIRIPLIFRGPGVAPRACETPVSHLDVLPTLAERLDLPAPDGIDGVPLGDALARTAPPRRPVFCQYSGNPTVGDIRRTVIDGNWKLTCDDAGAADLYDLAADPLETVNLAVLPRHAERRARLHKLLVDWAAAHGDWVTIPPP